MTKQIVDRPVLMGKRDDPPRATCGCLTYFSTDEQYWIAKHDDHCGRKPIRRREAILATRAKM